MHCIRKGAKIETEYKAVKIIERSTPQTIAIKKDGKILFETDYKTMTKRNNTIYLK